MADPHSPAKFFNRFRRPFAARFRPTARVLWHYRAYLRNFRKDIDARKRAYALVSTGVFLGLIGGLAIFLMRYLAGKIGAWTIPFYGFMLGSGLVACQFIRKLHAKQDELLSGYSFRTLSSAPREPPATHIAAYFSTRAKILSSMVIRSRRELKLKSRKAASGTEPMIIRQVVNYFLRSHGLWDALEPAEVALMSVKEGAWPPEAISEIVNWCEQLRLLRWVLRFDRFLVPLSHYRNLEVSMDGLPAKVIVPRVTLQPCDVRAVRNVAFGYLLSIALEMSRRGLLPYSEMLETRERTWRVRILGKSSEFVADGRYISELKNEELKFLLKIAHARSDYCEYLIQQLGAEEITAYSQWSGRRRNAGERRTA